MGLRRADRDAIGGRADERVAPAVSAQKPHMLEEPSDAAHVRTIDSDDWCERD